MSAPRATVGKTIRICLLTITMGWSLGCSLAKYRSEADQEVFEVIAERNMDPRWYAPDTSIEIDPRSRFYDPYDPDCSPMPQDDPTSQQYMRRVDGKKGWKHWWDRGERSSLENEGWRETLQAYAPQTDEGKVRLDIDSALELAYIHSPTHQSQLETLYLSALDVSEERFRFDTQFFGGYDARYAHNGSLIPPSLSYSPFLDRFVVNPAIEGPGIENNRLTLGRPFGAVPALEARKRFATAGELLTGFANSFIFEFTGGDANLSASLLNFSLVQPLLRGAGKDIALEQLTFAERNLLANLRSYSQFRQGFYTQIAIGELGVSGPSRFGSGTSLQSFGGDGFVGGYLGLLQQEQQIRNTTVNLNLQRQSLAQLEALEDIGVISLVQVLQLEQSVQAAEANLLRIQNQIDLTLDRYKTGILGLPPDVEIEIDDSLIQPFQLVDPSVNQLQSAIVALQDEIGSLASEVTEEQTADFITAAYHLVEAFAAQIDATRDDLVEMEQASAGRAAAMAEEQRREFEKELNQLRKKQSDLELKTNASMTRLEEIAQQFVPENRVVTTRALVVWLGNFNRNVQQGVLVQARARLESIRIDPVILDSQEAFSIALQNRLDFMNGRASLVDQWRLIQVNADALQSVLNVTADGDIRTAENNPVSFRAPTSNVRLGLEFDAPLTRLIERNDYRESLINYQRSRRALIQSEDSLHLGLRALLRQAKVLQETLEIQREAVRIAIKRVDVARLELEQPVAPPLPGQRAAQFGPTAARDLQDALSSLRDTQNAFLAVYLDYYATRMRLARELGLMELDERGKWIEKSLTPERLESLEPGNTVATEMPDIPPDLPEEWMGLAEGVQAPVVYDPVTMPPATMLAPVGARLPHDATSMAEQSGDQIEDIRVLRTEDTDRYKTGANRY